MSSEGSKPNYGYDRPDFARNLPIGIGFIVFVTILYLESILIGWTAIVVLVFGWALGIIFLFFGMIFLLSKNAKLKNRDVLLDAIPWRGDEMVLDVGCGPGLLLVGAAKKLTTGKAVGVDVWAGTVSSNSPTTTLRNAKLEGVEDRIEVKDGDVRNLTFKDGNFDVVMASAVLHHIRTVDERTKALQEMVRVLKQNGHIGLILIDFRRLPWYIQTLKGAGLEPRVLRPNVNPNTNRAFGTVILVARKTGAGS